MGALPMAGSVGLNRAATVDWRRRHGRKFFIKFFWGIPSDWPETGKGARCASPVFSSAEGLWS